MNPFNLPDKEKENYSLDDFKSFVRNVIIPSDIYGNRSKDIQDEVIEFYLSVKPEKEHDRLFYLECYAKVLLCYIFITI